MSFVAFNGKGYNSFVAESTDLVHWKKCGWRWASAAGEFDFGGCVIGAFLYESYDLRAPACSRNETENIGRSTAVIRNRAAMKSTPATRAWPPATTD